jgi:choice-of-anchor B domain-containing protein
MKFAFGILCLFFSLSSFSQLNMSYLGKLDYDLLHNAGANDVWGYVDETGIEYGLVGTTEGTGIVDLSDPTTPLEIFWEPGTYSTWRDLKTHGDYAYVTTEALQGLLIIDLSPLPASAALTTSYYTGPVADEWRSAHNLYVDPAGYGYIFGANRGNGGVIILDLFTDPLNPIEIGVFDDWYVHDGFVLGDTMYLAHINEGTMSVVDISDRTNPILLGTKTTPNSFAHNIWASDDGNFVFTTDEKPYSYITAYDVSDPTNIVEVDRIQSSPGIGVIPHNTHVFGDYLVTSHYADGVVIHDATYPYNLVEVGYYDTYPGQTAGYDGCWGAYPFLPSGIVLATDRSEGFFVLGSNYTKAAYLEGTATDAVTLLPIDLVDIVITGDEQTENSNTVGFYATGIATGGTYDVTYSKIGYFPQTISVPLVNGVITIQDVQLTPIPPYSLTVIVLETGTSNPIVNADIRLKASLLTHEGVSNGIGEEDFTLFYEEVYTVTVGSWGHITECSFETIDNTTGSLTVYLNAGIYDDFAFDFGWTTSGSATSGLWERAIPFGTSSGSAPSVDYGADCDEYAYVTGNDPSPSPDEDDVDGGAVVLRSPIIDLSTFSDPYVNYVRWFYTMFGPQAPDDSMYVSISNGTDIVQIDVVGDEPTTFGAWQPVNVRIADFISITSTMQFIFRTDDFDPFINITEAGLDLFFINEGIVSVDEIIQERIAVYPNPTNGNFDVINLSKVESYYLISTSGKIVNEGELSPNASTVNMTGLDSGMYFLNISGQVVKIFKTN